MSINYHKKLILMFSIVAKLFFWLIGIIAICLLVLKITGNSPTTDQIIITMLLANLGVSLTMFFKFGYKFGMIESQIKYIKRDIHSLRKNFHELKIDFKSHLMEHKE